MSLITQSASAHGAGLNGWTRLALAFTTGALLGAGVAAVSPGPFLIGWAAAAVLLIPCIFILLYAWRWGGRDRALAWIISLAFLLRLAAGVGLSLALPVWGYVEPEQQAGYAFMDAYSRDTQAWELAQSGDPLWASFRNEFATDQYGGLLALSALVYRTLSPDAHRPFLILILGAFFAALGAPFLRKAIRLRFPARVASIAVWIYALYPDAIFFGSSQMREPFVVGLACIAFWAVIAWDWRTRPGEPPASLTWVALAGSLLGMALFSSRVAAALTGFLGLLFLMEHILGREDRPGEQGKRWQTLGWIGLVLGSLLVFLYTWEWFQSSATWDLIVTMQASGWIKKIIQEVGEQWRFPIIVVYGLAQPVLPAAVAEDSIAMAKTIAIVRAAGWYALAPFLAYGIFTVWKESDPRKRRRAIWLALVVTFWLLIAAARGGGDATDNPRYRSILIPWLALLAAWSIDWALSHRDAWLWRWIAVEVIFLGFFTNWYFSRYFHTWKRLPFWQMVVWIVVLSGLVLVGGWVWDRVRRRKASLSE
jgi:hypothetical protein